MSDAGKAAQSAREARLVEAAERAVLAVSDDAAARGWKTVDNAAAVAMLPGPFRAAIALRDALAAHRASVDALVPGLLPETVARVNAALDAERAKTEAMKRERDEALKERQKTYDLCHAALDDVKAPKVGSSAERIAALAAERDVARKERDALFATREADRRMLKNRDEDYEQAAAERDALKAEVERLRTVRDAMPAPGSSAERRAALAAERDAAAEFSRSDWRREVDTLRDAVYEATRQRDALKTEVERLRADQDTTESPDFIPLQRNPAWSTPLAPAPAPLDPRALAIYEGAVRAWAAIPRANGFSVTDQVFEAAEILRAAEAEARKGVTK